MAEESSWGPRRLFPVIHCVSPDRSGGVPHVIENIAIALENGSDGVFLIGHNLEWQSVLYLYESAREKFPQSWIGVNLLDLSLAKEKELLEIMKSNPSGFWTDECATGALNTITPPSVETFTGVAFKGRNQRATFEEAREECEATVEAHSNVAVTSGDHTGKPPSIEKLKMLHELLANRTPLAVASGASVTNVLGMLPYVHTFLVASSLTRTTKDGKEYLLPERVKAFKSAIS